MFENLVMSGSTGPVTLAGTIVLQTAEILSGLVLTQLVNPGLPVIFGCLGGVTDMRRQPLNRRSRRIDVCFGNSADG